MKDNALIIFVKTPVPGHVKTRLLPDITKTDAASLYSAFLKDLQRRFENRSEFTCWYAVAPEKFNAHKIKSLIRSKKIFLQSGIDLGQRMSNALSYLFDNGYKNIVLIGSDVPHLPIQMILRSFRLLQQQKCQVVLGPATDGGYNLIGMFELLQDLFSGIHWSTEEVLSQTLEKAKNNHYVLQTLKQLSDIDDYQSLRNLHRCLHRMNPKLENFPADTWVVLDKIMKSKN